MVDNVEFLLLSALPAAGKTTYAEEWVAEDPAHRNRMNWDDLRLKLFGPTWKFNRKDEEHMKSESRDIVRTYLEGGQSVVIDNTNLTERARNQWISLAKQCNANVQITQHEIDTPVRECVRRDRLRDKRVGQAVIDRMALFHGFVDWGNPSEYHPSACGKDFVVFDVDGTIADCEHRRHYVRPEHKLGCSLTGLNAKQASPESKSGHCPECGNDLRKDWPAFFRECVNDTPIQPIFELAKLLSRKYYILIVSGRPMDLCGKATEDWLLKHSFPKWEHLFMRDNGDGRDDTIVKREIGELLPLERIAYVIDDRPKVVKMWRELGLTTLTVGDLKEF